MAVTSFSSSNPNVVKLWSERTIKDFESNTAMLGKMMADNIIKKQEETSRSSGDRVTISFLNRLTDQGLLGMEAATGVESSLTYASDNLLINQLRIPVVIPAPATIDTQRVQFNLQEDTYRTMSDWIKVRGTLGVLNQLAGNTANTINYDGVAYSGNDRLKVTGLNPVTAASRVIRANDLATDEAVAADSTATLTVSMILDAEKQAMQARPYIKPLSENGAIKYHLYVHTEQWDQLLNDTSSPIQLRDINLARVTAGESDGSIPESMIISNTKIMRTDKIPLGINSSTNEEQPNVRRAVFCGEEAGAVAYGQGYSDGKSTVPGFRINQDFTDINNLVRYAIVGVFGIKKLQFEGVDHGSIVLSSYSAT